MQNDLDVSLDAGESPVNPPRGTLGSALAKLHDHLELVDLQWRWECAQGEREYSAETDAQIGILFSEWQKLVRKFYGPRVDVVLKSFLGNRPKA